MVPKLLSLWIVKLFLVANLCAQNFVIHENSFVNDLEGWQPLNPWQHSTEDAISPGNGYLRMPVGINPGNKGSKLIAFNPDSPWTGDLLASGVTALRFDFANWSSYDDANLRVVFGNRASPQQTGGTWWTSKAPVLRPLNSDWSQVTLNITEESMQRVANLSGELGLDSFEDTLADVRGFRILSSALGHAAVGDAHIGVVGVDNIQLIGIPEYKHTSIFVGIGALMYFLRRKLLSP